MYLPTYFQELVHDSTSVKFGAAAVTSLLITASHAYGALFFVVIACWMVDMLFGTMRVLRELLKAPKDRKESFRWTRSGDGLLRLMVIVVIPGLLAMVGSVATEVTPFLSEETKGVISEAPANLATFVLAWMLVHEFISVLNNAAMLHPGLRTARARLVSWIPEGGTEDQRVEIALIEPKGGGK